MEQKLGKRTYLIDDSSTWHICFNPEVNATALVQVFCKKKNIQVIFGNHIQQLRPLMEQGITLVKDYFRKEQWKELEKNFI